MFQVIHSRSESILSQARDALSKGDCWKIFTLLQDTLAELSSLLNNKENEKKQIAIPQKINNIQNVDDIIEKFQEKKYRQEGEGEEGGRRDNSLQQSNLIKNPNVGDESSKTPLKVQLCSSNAKNDIFKTQYGKNENTTLKCDQNQIASASGSKNASFLHRSMLSTQFEDSRSLQQQSVSQIQCFSQKQTPLQANQIISPKGGLSSQQQQQEISTLSIKINCVEKENQQGCQSSQGISLLNSQNYIEQKQQLQLQNSTSEQQTNNNNDLFPLKNSVSQINSIYNSNSNISQPISRATSPLNSQYPSPHQRNPSPITPVPIKPITTHFSPTNNLSIRSMTPNYSSNINNNSNNSAFNFTPKFQVKGIPKHRQSRSIVCQEDPQLDTSQRQLHSRTPSQNILRESNSTKAIKPITDRNNVCQQQTTTFKQQLSRPKDSFFNESMKQQSQQQSSQQQATNNISSNNSYKKDTLSIQNTKHQRHQSQALPSFQLQSDMQDISPIQSGIKNNSGNQICANKSIDNQQNLLAAANSLIGKNNVNMSQSNKRQDYKTQLKAESIYQASSQKGKSLNSSIIKNVPPSNVPNSGSFTPSVSKIPEIPSTKSSIITSTIPPYNSILTPSNNQNNNNNPQSNYANSPSSNNINLNNQIQQQQNNQKSSKPVLDNDFQLNSNQFKVETNMIDPSLSLKNSSFQKVISNINLNNSSSKGALQLALHYNSNNIALHDSFQQQLESQMINKSPSELFQVPSKQFGNLMQRESIQQNSILIQSPTAEAFSHKVYPEGDNDYNVTLQESVESSYCKTNNEYSSMQYQNTLPAPPDEPLCFDSFSHNHFLTKYSNINLKIKDFSSKKGILFSKETSSPSADYIPTKLFEEFFITGPSNQDVQNCINSTINDKIQAIDAKVLYHFNSQMNSASQYSTHGSSMNATRLSDSNNGSSSYSSQNKIINEFSFPFGCQVKHLKMTNSFSSFNEILFANNSTEQGSSQVSCFVLAFRQGSDQFHSSHQLPAYNSKVLSLLEKMNPSKTLYCVCFKVKDFIESTKLESSKASYSGAQLLKSQSTTNMSKSRMKFWQTEKVYTFVTYFPLVRFFLRIITSILNIVKIKRIKTYNERLDTIPNTLASIDSDFFTQTFINIAEKTFNDLLSQDLPDFSSLLEAKIEYERISIFLPTATEANKLETEWGVLKAMRQIDLNNLLFLFLSLLLEHSLVFVSKDTTLLTSTLILFQNSLIRPLKWVHPMVFTLPEKLLPVLGSPVPILVGINKDLLYVKKMKLDQEFSNCIFIQLGSTNEFKVVNANIVTDITLDIFNEIKEKIEPYYKNMASHITNGISLQESEEGRAKQDCYSLIEAMSCYLQNEIFSKMPTQAIYTPSQPDLLDYEQITNKTITAVGKHKNFLQTLFKTQMLTYYMEERYSKKRN